MTSPKKQRQIWKTRKEVFGSSNIDAEKNTKASNVGLPLVNNSLPVRYCPQCGEPLRHKRHKTWCEHYEQ
ncbi:MAG: hypothetical protein GF364_14970 [Candidatus Lokiarchaeota archaeon]|nr:hypothetical protein [Candidatus Lokiarchaeota archaeon]